MHDSWIIMDHAFSLEKHGKVHREIVMIHGTWIMEKLDKILKRIMHEYSNSNSEKSMFFHDT